MALSAAQLKVGDVHTARLVEDLKRTQIVQYAGASGDYNPLHTDEVFTTKVAGYPSVFAHGMLTMGMTGKMLTDYVGDTRLTKYGVRFTSQLESRLLADLLNKMDDPNGGSLITDDFIVNVVNLDGNLTVEITDRLTGEVSEIIVNGYGAIN